MNLALSISCACILVSLSACGNPSTPSTGNAPSPASEVGTAPPAPPPAETASSPTVPSPAPAETLPQTETAAGTLPLPDPLSDEVIDPMGGRKELASLPKEFYGRWRLTGSGGGFDGHADPARKDDEMIVITRANTIETWKGGKVISTAPFRIARGRSIFGNDSWLIYRRGISLDVISLRGKNELNISENHVECMSWSYERVAESTNGD